MTFEVSPLHDYNLDAPFTVQEVRGTLTRLVQLGESVDGESDGVYASPEEVCITFHQQSAHITDYDRQCALLTSVLQNLAGLSDWRASVDVLVAEDPSQEIVSIEVHYKDTDYENRNELEAGICLAEARKLIDGSEETLSELTRLLNGNVRNAWRTMHDSGDGVRHYYQFDEDRPGTPETRVFSANYFGQGKTVVPFESR